MFKRFQFTLPFSILFILSLAYANFSIWWDTTQSGPFIAEFFDMGNLIFGWLIKGWTLGLDEHLGIHFFAPVTWWILDGMTYFISYSAALILIWNIYFVDDAWNSTESLISKLIASAFFISFYYFHLFDSIGFFASLSMPVHGRDIDYYFWIPVGGWLLVLILNHLNYKL